ncbi:hypothetical protein RCZ04_04980 [Capnocytophaga sp. HP1101]
MKKIILIAYILYQLLAVLQFSFSINALHGTEREIELLGENYNYPTTKQYAFYIVNMIMYILASSTLLGLYIHLLKSQAGKIFSAVLISFSALFLSGWVIGML